MKKQEPKKVKTTTTNYGWRASEGIFLSACKRLLFLGNNLYSIRFNSFVRSSTSGEGFHHINENRKPKHHHRLLQNVSINRRS
jgi:hypothetical protein